MTTLMEIRKTIKEKAVNDISFFNTHIIEEMSQLLDEDCEEIICIRINNIRDLVMDVAKVVVKLAEFYGVDD